MKLFFLKWLISWCRLTQGIIGVLSFGLYSPSVTLWAARKYSREKFLNDLNEIEREIIE